jgi:hypothetical protein
MVPDADGSTRTDMEKYIRKNAEKQPFTGHHWTSSNGEMEARAGIEPSFRTGAFLVL